MNTAIKRGLEFLLRTCDRAGWWRDFETLAGPSDEWVTAYVAWSIASIPGGDVAAREALALLEPRCRDGGFGYAAHVPPDCDTTGWVCRLAEAIGQTASPAYRCGLSFLRAAIRSDGGVPTYPEERRIRQFTQLPMSVSFDGWTASHICVTAAVSGLAGLADELPLKAFLKTARKDDGCWRGYWWTASAYPTMLAALALGIDERATAWACASNEDTAFSLACRSVLGAPMSGKLLALQLPDGSWPASAELRIPPPFVANPDAARPRMSLDRNRLYTTATVVRALHEQSRTA